jgi:anti-sigma factor RsiW
MRPNDEISCVDASDFLEPYLDGDLPPREADRLREHLGTTTHDDDVVSLPREHAGRGPADPRSATADNRKPRHAADSR